MLSVLFKRSISSVGGSTCLIHTRSWVRAPHGTLFIPYSAKVKTPLNGEGLQTFGHYGTRVI